MSHELHPQQFSNTERRRVWERRLRSLKISSRGRKRGSSPELSTKRLWKGLLGDLGLKDQIRRSAVSIMSNIAEGFERGRPSEVPSVSFNRKRLVRRVAVATLRRARRWLHNLGPFSTTDDRGDRNSSSTWRSAPLG